MRKIFAFMFIGIFVLAGCKDRNTGILKLSGISFNADIHYRGTHYTAECSVGKNKSLKLRVLSPENINGLTFMISADECKSSLNGIEISENDIFYPDNSLIKLLYKTIIKCDGKHFNASKEKCKTEGKIGEFRYLIAVSPGGLPIKMQIRDIDLEISFNKLTVLK